jgi:Lysyl oxidase/WD40-like Beta Propeller Repeat
VTALAALAFALAGIHVGGHQVLGVGYAPAWSPNGLRLAYVTRGDLWVADADGSRRALLVPRADQPAWAPDGRRLAFTRGGFVYTVRADGLDERKLARGAHPAWSPDGNRLAFDRDDEIVSVNWYGGGTRKLADGTEPAFAPDGRLAYVQDGVVVSGTRTVGEGGHPTWAPDSQEVAYSRDGAIYVDGRRLAPGYQPAWKPRVRVQELLPDFDTRAPSGLAIAGGPGRWLLGFTSMVDNVGLGPSMIVGLRPPGHTRMTATQHVELANGSWRTYPAVGQLRYTNSPPHHHWHLMKFVAFTLRTLDGGIVVSDRKSGFCLADHWGAAPGYWPHRHARFLNDCEAYNPAATHVVEGTSVGYTDRYPGFFHGQNVDVTHVPAGVYDLVHVANPSMLLHELRYENDAASVRVRLTWHAGVPRVTVLRSCQATARC